MSDTITTVSLSAWLAPDDGPARVAAISERYGLLYSLPHDPADAANARSYARTGFPEHPPGVRSE